MMNKSKLLININNLNEISEYEKIGITNFLFAIKDFSIGYNTFTLNEIPDNSYILINRVMDTKTIEELKTIKDELKRFKGIFFEDLGVYNNTEYYLDRELILNEDFYKTMFKDSTFAVKIKFLSFG